MLSHSQTVKHVDRAGLTEDTCGGSATFLELDGLTSGSGKVVDYIEKRVATTNANGGIDETVTRSGVRCLTAKDVAACNAASAKATSDTGVNIGPSGPITEYVYFVFTRGDTVFVVASLADLVKVVAPVKTVQNAAFLAALSPAGRDEAVACGSSTGGAVSGGFKIVQGGDCFGERSMFVSTDGADIHVVEVAPNTCSTGRRPEGLVVEPRARETLLGGFFAELSQLEAASVFAFDRLARELSALDAPDHLVKAAERSREDEVRHTSATAHLARRFGGQTAKISVGPLAVRSLFEVALENAVEGCIRETYGALVATYQARHANDAHVRRAMRVISEDETRHAELAWDVASWAEPLLTPEERNEVERARVLAARQLRDALGNDVALELVAHAGIPAAEHALAMFDQLISSLQSPGDAHAA